MKSWTTGAQLDHLYGELGRRLPPRRLAHVMGGAQYAVALALRWGTDANEALTAMLLHDVAKNEPRERLRAIIEAHPGEDDPEDRAHPSIWHAVAGAILAREEFGVPSAAVHRAIRLHPTGDAEMSLLDKIVFLADYIEPNRSHPAAEPLRRLAFENLDEAVCRAIATKTDHLRERGRRLHPRSQRAWEAHCGARAAAPQHTKEHARVD